MRRRDVMTMLAGATAYPLLASAQQKAMPVIGFLSAVSAKPHAPFVAAFRLGLSDGGYVEGQNLEIEYRWAEGGYDRLPALAADLVGRKVELIVAQSDQSALAAKNATSTTPIVFIAGNPVGGGLVTQFGDQFETLRDQLNDHDGNSGEVAAWPGEARNETGPDRVAYEEDDRDGRGRAFCCARRSSALRCDYVDLTVYEIGGQRRQPIVTPLGPTVFDRQVLSIDEAGFA
jgi:hypothetical protein